MLNFSGVFRESSTLLTTPPPQPNGRASANRCQQFKIFRTPPPEVQCLGFNQYRGFAFAPYPRVRRRIRRASRRWWPGCSGRRNTRAAGTRRDRRGGFRPTSSHLASSSLKSDVWFFSCGDSVLLPSAGYFQCSSAGPKKFV